MTSQQECRVNRTNWTTSGLCLLLGVWIAVGTVFSLAIPSNSSASAINLAASAGSCGPLPPPSWPNFKSQLDNFVMNLCYQKQQWPHEANRRSSEGLHAPYVRLWYSPQLY